MSVYGIIFDMYAIYTKTNAKIDEPAKMKQAAACRLSSLFGEKMIYIYNILWALNIIYYTKSK